MTSATTGAARFDFADGVRVLLFDAGNTLLWIDHARIAAILGALAVPCDEASVRRAEMLARPRLDPLLARATKRESAEVFHRYVDLVLENLGHAVGDDALRRAARRAIEETWPELWTCPPPDAHDTLRALRSRGYRLGVVSNSTGRARALLDDAGLLPELELVVDSGHEGVEKPDPRLFLLAAERLAVAPALCCYVGDFHALDVVGPRRAGMQAILLDPIGAFEGWDAPRVASLSELLHHFRGV